MTETKKESTNKLARVDQTNFLNSHQTVEDKSDGRVLGIGRALLDRITVFA